MIENAFIHFLLTYYIMFKTKRLAISRETHKSDVKVKMTNKQKNVTHHQTKGGRN